MNDLHICPIIGPERDHSSESTEDRDQNFIWNCEWKKSFNWDFILKSKTKNMKIESYIGPKWDYNYSHVLNLSNEQRTNQVLIGRRRGWGDKFFVQNHMLAWYDIFSFHISPSQRDHSSFLTMNSLLPVSPSVVFWSTSVGFSFVCGFVWDKKRWEPFFVH